MFFAILKIFEQFLRFLGFRHEIRLAQDAPQIELVARLVNKRKQIFGIHHADNIINAAMIDRHAGVQFRAAFLDERFEGILHRKTEHVRAGNHDFFDADFVEINQIGDNFPFGGLDDALALADIEHGAEFLPRPYPFMAGARSAEQAQNAVGDAGQNHAHGKIHIRKKQQRTTGERGKPFGKSHGVGFRCDFPENQEQKHHADGGGHGAEVIAQQPNPKRGGRRRGENVHDLVSHQNRH